MFLFYLLPLIGSLVGYRNSRLALIFLRNFEGIASLLSRFSVVKSCMLLIPDVSNVARVLFFVFFVLFCCFSGNLWNVFAPSVVQFHYVSWWSLFHRVGQIVHSFLLEIRGLQFGTCSHIIELMNSFFFVFTLSETVNEILDKFSNFLFFSLYSFLSFFTVSSGTCPQFFP